MCLKPLLIDFFFFWWALCKYFSMSLYHTHQTPSMARGTVWAYYHCLLTKSLIFLSLIQLGSFSADQVWQSLCRDSPGHLAWESPVVSVAAHLQVMGKVQVHPASRHFFLASSLVSHVNSGCNQSINVIYVRPCPWCAPGIMILNLHQEHSDNYLCNRKGKNPKGELVDHSRA